MRGRCVGFLPHDHFMALLQTQALHSEDHPFQHTRQGVGEGDLGGHLLADHSISQRLPEGNSKKVRRVEPNLSRNKSKTANTEKRKKNLKPTLMVRSGVRSLKVVWLANTCWVSLTLPDRVSIRAAWSTSWFWYCW